MLKTRVITAVVLLAVILPIMAVKSYIAFALLSLAFFGAAIWECQRLFNKPMTWVVAAIWTAVLGYLLFNMNQVDPRFLFAFSIAVWAVRLAPSLRKGLPPAEGFSNGMLSTVYSVCILTCFLAMATMFVKSVVFLLSVMAIVWIADSAAYFSGKAFGKHKLAPSISPGKSWEGAVGGWCAVIACSFLVVQFSSYEWVKETISYRLVTDKGYLVALAVLTVMTAASVVGDLFESALKRRVGMKDSSHLLPGHGGVLDRIDALIPVLPIAALISL